MNQAFATSPGTTHPQTLLRAELARRCEKNPRYSLRSFARASGISHTVLSLVMSGKRPLSRKAALKLADFLGLDPSRKTELLENRADVLPAEQNVEQLSLDAFAVIADWYHLAILTSLSLSDARFEARWLARKFSISELEAKMAMERLERLGLVEEFEAGRWRQSGAPLRFTNTETTAAVRKFHRQLLEKAMDSLESDPMPIRDFSSMTLAIDPAQLPYAQRRIRQFRRELAAELAALTLTMILLTARSVWALPPVQARVVLELVSSPGLMPAPSWSDYRILADGKVVKVTYSGFGAQIASQTETLGMLSSIVVTRLIVSVDSIVPAPLRLPRVGDGQWPRRLREATSGPHP